jgi:hypothetical protein
VVNDTSDDTDHADDMAHDDGDMDHADDMARDHGDMDHTDDMAHDHGDMDHTDDMAHNDDDMDHGNHDHIVDEPITLPTTEAEIDAFVAAVRASPEMHIHDHASSKAGEHMAAMDLVPRDAATHIAIGHGDWDDPANWHNGEVPGDDARVLIPEGVHMTYDHVSDTRLFTVRVDGKLEFSTEVSSQMVVDTIVISPSGALQIGTEANPVDPDVNVDIIFANNGAIDTDWDPMLLSRGMVAHGIVEIHGAEKDSHVKVIDDPRAGDTWVDFGETPDGWAVGDTIVIAGSQYKGYTHWDPSIEYIAPEDEIRVITQIEDGQVFFDGPLIFDHDAPRDDLKISVANYTRNVSFETENADLAETYERGHVMFMHNDDVDVRYAEFYELGRTDKSEPARNVGEFDEISFDSNVKGRYSFHFHRAGVDDQDDPGMAVGNAVYGSPGWGFVHHDSHAIFDNNASYDTFGAGFIAESGNETGAWTDNIAIFAQGRSWKDPKIGNDVNNYDLGTTGDGFWFQSRMVESVDNIAASVNNGFVYFHRGPFGENGQIRFDSEITKIPGALDHWDALFPDDHPIISFSGNETFASRNGLYVAKANPKQGHDVHTFLDDFTAWNVNIGADISYTSHYILNDFDLVAGDPNARTFGITFGTNTSDMTVVDANIEGFDYGIWLKKDFIDPSLTKDDHDYTLVNPTFTDVGRELETFNPEYDTLVQHDDLPYLTPDIAFDEPLVVKNGNYLRIAGTKQDSLGETAFPTDVDDYDIKFQEYWNLLEHEGYYSTSGGENYFMLDIFFSDRLTGDIYLEKHPVFIGEPHNTDLVEYHGVQDLGGEDDPTIDSAILWATLTEGQLVLSDEAIEMQEKEEEEPLLEAGGL